MSDQTKVEPLDLKIVRRDQHMTEFTAEENYILTRGYEICARISPTSSGEWKVSWPFHTKHFDTRDEALEWAEANKEHVAATPNYLE